MYINRQGFTLVELIVVITILAILATISFVSFSGFALKSRDTSRQADLKTITRVIEIFETTNNLYPDPTDGVSITYSGSEVWNQGVFGDDTRIELSGKSSISDSPLDPITGNKYTYSVLNTKKEYQVGGILEGGLSNNNSIFNTTHAGTQEGTAYIKGDYNGAIAKVYSGSIDTTFILAVPSIINSDLDDTDLVDLIENNKLVYEGFNNLPASYSGSNYNTQGVENVLLLNTGSLVVYEGNFDNLQSANDADRISMIEAIQQAYTGTVIENTDIISSILNQVTTDEKSVYSNMLVKNTLGGTPPPVVYAPCGTSTHGDIKNWYSSETLAYGGDCNLVSQSLTCENGLWKDGTTTVDTAPLYESCSVTAGSNCTAGSTTGTTYGSIIYNYGAVNHTNNTGATGSNSIANGTENYTATATCTNGSVVLSDESMSITCNSGSVLNGNSCIEGKIIFVGGATASRGNAGGLAGADASCQGRADGEGLTGVFKAWLSSSTVSASSRLTHSTIPYIDVNGTIIADNWTDLTDGSIDNLIVYGVSGNSLTDRTYLTNTNSDGSIISTDLSYTCQDWTSESSSYRYYYGDNRYTNSLWTNAGYSGQNCSWAVRLLCIEQ